MHFGNPASGGKILESGAWREPFDDPDWLFEFKYDGYRGLCLPRERPRPVHLAFSPAALGCPT